MSINIPLCLLSLWTLQGFGSSVLASEKIAYIFIINHNITQPTWPVAFMQEREGSPKRKVTERTLWLASSKCRAIISASLSLKCNCDERGRQ